MGLPFNSYQWRYSLGYWLMFDGDTLDHLNKRHSSIHIMTPDHLCFFVNEYWQQLHGLSKHQSDVEGLPYSSMPHKAFYHCAEQFQTHDQTIFDTRATLSSLEIHEYETRHGWQAFHLTSRPYMVNGKVQCLIGEALPLPEHIARYYWNVKERAVRYYGQNNGKILLSNPDGLCDCEFENVYLLILGLKPQQIARHRGIAASTVYTALNNLRLRLKVSNNAQLVEYAIHRHWYNHIPAMFRHKETTLLLK